ncbi:MAG: ribonuclease P protein component [Clostridia bacterium]|nr:ribonuclease P protein component [Clostridia bacterium]
MKNYDKLKANRDFHRIYNRGKSFVAPTIVTYVRRCKGDGVHLGITAGKKVGGAVQRNRAKRVIAAAFRECSPYIAKGSEIVIVARTRILEYKSTEIATILKKQLKAAQVWCENELSE